ncbi:MAG: hypothetical protein GY714_15105 [Desulfobacterales bacterium]|nr:hypothetical protein [Desulfobacterales bacterium]
MREKELWQTHCQILYDLYATNFRKDISEQTVNPQGGKGLDKIITGLNDWQTTHKSKYKEICKKEPEWEFYQNTIMNSESKLDNEIWSAVTGLSAYARKTVTRLTRDKNGDKVKLLKNTELYKIFKIGYLNRKLCIPPESIAKITDPNVFTGINQKIKNLATNTLKPRISWFGVPNIDFDMNSAAAYKNERDKLKNRDGKNALITPFTENCHRVRTNIDNKYRHPDSNLLSLDAGALGKTPTEKSTLGKLRSLLGLPLRCDISGTTTDAVGFAKTLYEINGEGKKNQALHILCCMLSMCLSGHHSLDEIGVALSLSATNKFYDPLNPASSVFDLLKNVTGCVLTKPSRYDYYNAKTKNLLWRRQNESMKINIKKWDILYSFNNSRDAINELLDRE